MLKPCYFHFGFFFFLALASITSCDNKEDPSLPVIQTIDISNVTSNAAHTGGLITSDGGAGVTGRGVCWGSAPEPTIDLSTKTSDGTGTGTYKSVLIDLSPGTNYYVRAYSTNKAGTVYGNELSFKTLAVLAQINTLSTTTITSTTAVVSGNIISDGGSHVTVRGVCWSQNANPTIALSTKTAEGSGRGEFTSSITGLTPGTKYYVRAYATNDLGTVYGDNVEFTTLPAMALLTTASITEVTSSTATGGGNISMDGGAPVTMRGVCWSTATGPTIDNNRTTDGAGSGSFASALSDLLPSTQYYVRAYATNSAGTAYGNEITFTTSADGNLLTVTDVDGNRYDMVIIGSQNWMAQNLRTTRYQDGTSITTGLSTADWSSTTSGAYCVMLDDPATFEDTYGKLYNFYSLVDSRKLCPAGTHPPSESEWNILINHLGGGAVAGGKMKTTGTTYWNSPNGAATNSSGFSGLPGGFRDLFGYGLVRDYGNFWSNSEASAAEGRSMAIRSNDGYALLGSSSKYVGYSVRCVQD